MINPLKQKEYNLLKDTGHQDLADKVQELVREFNKIEKTPEEEDDDETGIAHKIWDAATPYNAKMILKDYINKIK